MKGQSLVAKFNTKITPNYIHSMDAAHMAMTINKMYSEHKIRDFWAVHDCFGVHASDTDALVEVVRKSFHEIYSERTFANVGGNSFEIPDDAFEVDEILGSRYLIG
jgi:DNA-directed RNA polymerase